MIPDKSSRTERNLKEIQINNEQQKKFNFSYNQRNANFFNEMFFNLNIGKYF